MKILLTGKPRRGKTTLLHSLIDDVSSKHGMVAAEVCENGERIGFDLKDNTGRTAPLARVHSPTQHKVGRYFVDVNSLDVFIEPLVKIGPGALLYLDEIGHMQLFSEKFQQLATAYLDSDNDFIGTISSIYEHSFIDEVLKHKDILLCTVTPDNRDGLKAALQAALAHREQLNHLAGQQQERVLELARNYLATGEFTSLRKLFNNAIVYVANEKLEKLNNTEFAVNGNHARHIVLKQDLGYSCDCDLFNGRGEFTNQAGECSHVQVVKLSY